MFVFIKGSMLRDLAAQQAAKPKAEPESNTMGNTTANNREPQEGPRRAVTLEDILFRGGIAAGCGQCPACLGLDDRLDAWPAIDWSAPEEVKPEAALPAPSMQDFIFQADAKLTQFMASVEGIIAQDKTQLISDARSLLATAHAYGTR